MYPYIAFLRGTGLCIGFLTISWQTTAFNRSILKLTTKYKHLLNIWFDIGVYLTIILLPISLGIFLYAAFNIIILSHPSQSSMETKQSLIIEPIIPGVTSPLSEIGYYVIALGISSCVHELGHAVAAVREDVHLNEIGFNIYYIIPVTFVVISNDEMNKLQVKKKLRVLCAGVWHNLFVAIVAYLIFMTLPVLLKPLYTLNYGVHVTEVLPASPLKGMKGLESGDIILGINEHKIYNQQSWYDSLAHLKKPGYCVESDFVHALDESVQIHHNENSDVVECCNKQSSENLCFEYIEEQLNGYVHLPSHMCLPARKIVEHAKSLCYGPDQMCSLGLHCIKTVLPNTTSLIVIQRSNNKPKVVYIGLASDVFNTIKVSEYIPKVSFLPSKYAESVQTFFLYLAVFSFGLVLVNVVPCWYLDGNHILVALLQLTFGREKSTKFLRDVTALCMTILGTGFMVFIVIGSLWVNYVN